MSVYILPDSITIEDEYGTICYWVVDDWTEDPEVVHSILEAIDIFYRLGGGALRAHMQKELITIPAALVISWRVRQIITALHALRNQPSEYKAELSEAISLLELLIKKG
jgi:hypothetical protein